MPRRNETKRPQHVIDEAVKRHLENGESVASLSKAYKVSRAGFYNWLAKAKMEMVTSDRRGTSGPEDLENQEKAELALRIKMLTQENRQLRDRLVAYMLKDGV